MDFFRNNQIPTDQLRVLGCDGTPSNTGWNNGFMRVFEESVGSPLLHIVCQLHFIELPFSALMDYYDYSKKDSTGRRGLLGKLIGNDDMHKLPILRTDPFPIDQSQWPFPDFTQKGRDELLLRDDQSCFLEMSLGILAGDYERKVFKLKSGNLCNSRWLVCAYRTLQVWLTTKNPKAIPGLELIVEFILKVYSPLYFMIKRDCKLTDGPKNLFEMICRIRYLPPDILSVIRKSIQENPYYAHSEIILLAMLCDDKHKHEAINRIMAARTNHQERLEKQLQFMKKDTNLRQARVFKEKTPPAKRIRYYLKPEINFNARNYTQLVDLSDPSLVWEPPLTFGLSREELEDFTCPNLPNHTQGVERAVKASSREATKVYSQEKRAKQTLCRFIFHEEDKKKKQRIG